MAVYLTGRNPLKVIEHRTGTKTETVEFYPSYFDTADYVCASITNQDEPIGKNSSNTTYATINLTTGRQAETWVHYYFDMSSIPDNAIIESATFVAKASVSSTSSLYVNTRTIQMRSSGNLKGSSVNLTTSATAHTIGSGTWTVAELKDCYVDIYAKRGSSSTSSSRDIKFYGATATVTYTYDYEYDEEVWI